MVNNVNDGGFMIGINRKTREYNADNTVIVLTGSNTLLSIINE